MSADVLTITSHKIYYVNFCLAMVERILFF